MGQKKLKRFEEIASFPNVLQYPTGMKGEWHAFFGNNHPVTLELACGKGEYAVGLGMLYPYRNFIGVDLKGNRLWVGARRAIENGLQNVAFLRTHIDKITDYFEPGEVQEIWLTFPDPQLRISRAKKRLTHPKFLRLYQQIMAPGGYIHLKTDSTVLYEFTKSVANLYEIPLLEEIKDIHSVKDPGSELTIKTHYEGLDIAGSKTVYYLKFSLPRSPLPDLDHKLKEVVKQAETGSEKRALNERIDTQINTADRNEEGSN